MARVLVVDDEPGIRETLTTFLADAQHTASAAETVQQALAVLQSEPLDVVVSDIILPGATGIDLLRAVQRIAPRTKVVLITGEPNYASAAEAVRLGAHDYLPKPVTQAAICRVVDSAARVKAVEDENDHYRERLEEVVEERTRQLREQAESLRASEQKYRELAELSHTGIFVVRGDRIAYANRRALEIVGLDPSQPALAEGRELLGFIWPEDRGWVAVEIEAFLRGERRPNRLELRVVGPAGSCVWVEALLAVVEHKGQRALLGNILDISARRRAQEENARLQAQFLQAQKMEVVGRLAGGVAHDFNNLLTAFVGCSEFALQLLEPEHPARPHVGEIRRAADRAAALTQQLLAFSRKRVSDPRPVDLNSLLEQSRRMTARLLGEDIELVVEPGPRLWPIRADPTQVDQIILNLATNARDAMPSGGRLTLTTANVPAAQSSGHHDTVRLSVRDTGAGMSAEVRAQALEPFFTTKDRGTGLGLSTVRDIVERHGAHLEIDSSLGSGTCVSVSFPRLPAAELRDAAAIPEGAPPGGNETLLLVEDDAAVRRVTSRSLESLGYAVLQAASGAEAFAISATTPGEIQLLLSDVVLPGMDGLRVYEALRRTRPKLRQLFISGYAGDVLASRGIVEREVRLLEKPFSLQSLAAAVRQALDAQPSGGRSR